MQDENFDENFDENSGHCEAAADPAVVERLAAQSMETLRQQALGVGADEAVMANQHGRVACTAAGNIFVARGNRLLTPPVSEGALPGIIRGVLLNRGELLGMKIDEALLDESSLQQAEAIFVTNSLNGVVAAGYEGISATQKKQGHALNEALPKFLDF